MESIITHRYFPGIGTTGELFMRESTSRRVYSLVVIRTVLRPRKVHNRRMSPASLRCARVSRFSAILSTKLVCKNCGVVLAGAGVPCGLGLGLRLKRGNRSALSVYSQSSIAL